MTLKEAYDLAKRDGPSKELEEIIATDPFWAFSYARYILKGRFEDGELAISSDTHSSYIYSRDILRSEFVQGESAISHADEYALDYQFRFDRNVCSTDQLASYPLYALSYAISIRNRFPEGEPAMKRSPRIWKRYQHFLRGLPSFLQMRRSYDSLSDFDYSKQFELDIIGSPELSYLYAMNVLGGQFVDGEKSIARSPQYAFYYASDILKYRFKAGEESISKDACYSLNYAVLVIQGPFPAGESAIATHSAYSYQYASTILKDRFLAGELVISQTPYYALQYARDVIKGPFLLGEHGISQDPYFTYLYARDVISGPFSNGESVLINCRHIDFALDYQFRFNRDICSTDKLGEHPAYALAHAIMIGGRFPAGEPAMKRSPRIWKRYLEFINGCP